MPQVQDSADRFSWPLTEPRVPANTWNPGPPGPDHEGALPLASGSVTLYAPFIETDWASRTLKCVLPFGHTQQRRDSRAPGHCCRLEGSVAHILRMSTRGPHNICLFTKNLKALREARGLTQNALADQVGVSDSLVRAWEAGRSTPNYVDLMTLRRVLRVSIDELLGCVPMGASGRVQLDVDLPALIGELEELTSSANRVLSRLKRIHGSNLTRK